nr:3-hydroxyacyl-ACP dehydratase FabZ family protein [Calycomorphotria hydatis]
MAFSIREPPVFVGVAMPPQLLYNIDEIDFSQPVYDLDAIREVNPQRFEMEQLTAIVHIDRDLHGAVGYKQLTEDEFWCKGHMPGYPLMPGVIMCEAAAQLAGFYARKFDLLGGDFLGFGGMDEIRFRSPVLPGDRLDIAARLVKLRPGRQSIFEFQQFVNGKMVCSGRTLGVPLAKSGQES